MTDFCTNGMRGSNLKSRLPAAQKSISPCALHHIPQPEHRTPVGSVALATALDEARQSLQMPVASHPKDHIPPMCGQYGELAWRYLTLGDVGKSQSDSGDFCRSEVKWGFEITTHGSLATRQRAERCSQHGVTLAAQRRAGATL